ncbi:MAG: DUF4124 domain-containing protein [Candidatus Thiodiazotropha sp. (ex Lucinoma aequizonata)]|nr:DUF4124 domain-containing protein [Candidatus Thiodiazotropha sp. (ex Lucinoma aequizonata)]
MMALSLFARDVYKYTSEDGEIVYSERYHPDAERIAVSDKLILQELNRGTHTPFR